MTTDPIAEQLTHWRDQFTGRRTVPWEMLHEAERLVRASAAYHERQTRATIAQVADRLAALDEQHARELERAAERETRQRERAERAEAAEKAYRQQQTNTRETRETTEDGVVVRIQAPRTAPSSYAKDGHPRPWTLGELDQLLIRFRMAGGTDDTEVRWRNDYAEACVPFPELVIEPRPSRLPAPVEQPPRSLVVANRALAAPRLAIGLVLVVVALVVGAVVL